MFNDISQKQSINIEQQSVVLLPASTLIELCDSLLDRILKYREKEDNKTIDEFKLKTEPREQTAKRLTGKVSFYGREYPSKDFSDTFVLANNLKILAKTLKEVPVPYTDYRSLIKF